MFLAAVTPVLDRIRDLCRPLRARLFALGIAGRFAAIDASIGEVSRVADGQVFRGLFDATQRPGEFRFHLGFRQGWRDKTLFGLRSLFTPTDEDVALLSLPAPLFFLYSCLRPFRLAGKHHLKLKALQK